RLLSNLREPGRMAAVKAMMRATKADVEARLHDVQARTLVGMGSKDPDFADPVQEAADVTVLLRGTGVMGDTAGHYPHVEMIELVGPRVGDFLAGGIAKRKEGGF